MEPLAFDESFCGDTLAALACFLDGTVPTACAHCLFPLTVPSAHGCVLPWRGQKSPCVLWIPLLDKQMLSRPEHLSGYEEVWFTWDRRDKR